MAAKARTTLHTTMAGSNRRGRENIDQGVAACGKNKQGVHSNSKRIHNEIRQNIKGIIYGVAHV